MKKIYFILAVAATFTFSSCMNDEFIGGNTGTDTPAEEAINFGGGFQAVTRADLSGSSAAAKLENEFKVYGVKSDRDDNTKYNTVFPNFIVKYTDTNNGNAEYNDGWYYVGENNQTIRYWDYASDRYHFVAVSPVMKFGDYSLDGKGDIKSVTVNNLGGRLNRSVTSNAAAVYIADPVVMAKPSPAGTKYGEVMFTFRSMQSKVRVGIYETIPGYKITSITFYNNASTPDGSTYITLNSETEDYFQGSASGASGTITYDWSTSPASYTFGYNTTGITKGKSWEGGSFTGNPAIPATSSISSDLWGTGTDMASDGYFTVMPTPSNTTATPLTLNCNYVLTSLDDVDEIHVTGATATIPADYTKWAPNTAYTYLFKITDNTNGTTGSGSDPVGLYPITFDAAVVNVAEQNVGTETTVSTPSITCYQNGDVISEGIKFVEGADITVKTSVDATITVQELTGAFDYTKSYEQQSYDTSFGTSGILTLTSSATSTATFSSSDITANKTYVIKAVNGANVAYFVLVVGAAENGPAN